MEIGSFLSKVDILQSLETRSSAIQAESERIGSLSDCLKQRRDDCQKGSEAWGEELKALQQKVRDGGVSVGNSFEDYVFANYSFYTGNDFLAKFQEHVRGLRATLDKLSDTGNLWYKTEKWEHAKKFDFYELLFLNETPYVMTPTSLTLQSKSSVTVSFEPVFLGKAGWPFIRKEGKKEVVVRAKDSSFSYDNRVPVISDSQCEVGPLEASLKGNPLALVNFRRALGLEVLPDLQEQANTYVHEVATVAMEVLREQYDSVRENDRRILEIEAKYNAPQREDGMFATRPVIPDPEPEPFLAAIMSSDSRRDRDRNLKCLAGCVHDLDRTGLASYEVSIEASIRPGERKVYNLAEFSRYVRGVLELSIQARESAKV